MVVETLAAHALVFLASSCCLPLLAPSSAPSSSYLATPLLLFLLLPPALLPTALLATYSPLLLRSSSTIDNISSLSLLRIHTLSPSSFTHPWDARLLALATHANPLWPLLALAFITRVYLPLRWWAFRGLYIYGTAAVGG